MRQNTGRVKPGRRQQKKRPFVDAVRRQRDGQAPLQPQGPAAVVQVFFLAYNSPLQFACKQLERLSKKCEKAEKTEKVRPWFRRLAPPPGRPQPAPDGPAFRCSAAKAED